MELPAGFFGSSSCLSDHTLEWLLQFQALWRRFKGTRKAKVIVA